MTAVITADLHLADNPRDEYRHAFQQTFRQLIQKHKAQTVLVLGDLTEEKNRHDARLVNRVVNHFVELSRLCRIIIMTGNHDYSVEGNPFFAFLCHIENITWVNAPTEGSQLGLPNLPPDIKHSLFLPHTHNYKEDWAAFEFKNYRYIFAHNTFNGANVGFGRKLDGIPTDIFPTGVKVIAGDIHVPQDLDCVTYVGAPYTVDFGDAYEPRVLKLENNVLTSIAVDGPQKRLVEISSLKQLKKEEEFLLKGDILKVRVELVPEDHDRWAEIIDEIYDWGTKRGYSINQIQQIKSAGGKRPVKHVSRAPRSDEEILAAYAKAQGVDDATLKVGKQLLQKA